MKKSQKVKYFVKEYIQKPVSKKEFLKIQKEQRAEDMVLQSALIKNKTLTRSELDRLVRDGILLPEKYKSKICFKKDDVIKAIKKAPKQPGLFKSKL